MSIGDVEIGQHSWYIEQVAFVSVLLGSYSTKPLLTPIICISLFSCVNKSLRVSHVGVQFILNSKADPLFFL